MFHVMWNSDISETMMLKNTTEALKKRLPSDWFLSIRNEGSFSYINSSDAVLEINSPDKISAIVFVEVKLKTLEARDIRLQIDRWRNTLLNRATNLLNDEVSFMVIAQYLGKTARDELTREGISFADITGNMRFVLRRPAVFIETQGANKNPLREKTTLKSLRGVAQVE
jgi:hypothetical protein